MWTIAFNEEINMNMIYEILCPAACLFSQIVTVSSRIEMQGKETGEICRYHNTNCVFGFESDLYLFPTPVFQNMKRQDSCVKSTVRSRVLGRRPNLRSTGSFATWPQSSHVPWRSVRGKMAWCERLSLQKFLYFLIAMMCMAEDDVFSNKIISIFIF